MAALGSAAYSKIMKTIEIHNYITESGARYEMIPLTYEAYGQELGTAPIVLVNHALTGNSNVSGENGWWNQLIGSGKCIDTLRFTALAFNIPGNGYDGFLVDRPEDFSIADVSRIFLKGLDHLEIDKIYAVIGGSLGGSILWQMASFRPLLFEHIIPVATDWKATDWLLAQCRVQKQILANSNKPMHDARIHAMTFYRSPGSFTYKFNRSTNEELGIFNIESWLLHHGEKLQQRFQLKAYKLMNHLLTTADITFGRGNFVEVAAEIKGCIHLVGIGSDRFYLNDEILQTYELLSEVKQNVHYSQIDSIHGHDAFLIEYSQLSNILKFIFEEDNHDELDYRRKDTGEYCLADRS